ncbi:alpha-amylase family glycosyl hydrolase, partial [Orenia marismortui]|uniref:alpha-amylase family glycosyl hydrolase n=1 Tax=Orenia marismortui TaxID=46469 RepID=UPI0010671987
ITDDVKLEGGKVFITATNQDDPNDKHQQDTAVAEEISFEFSEVTEGASYDIRVIAKDEDAYAAYRGEASATIAASKNTVVEMELKLTAAEALSVELENLPAGNSGEVVLASATSEAIKADIDFENGIANFEQGIAANHYPLMVKIDGEIIKKGKLVLYPGRSTVVTVDMSASAIDLGDLPIRWEEPRNDFEAPLVTPSKEPKRYIDPIELTLDIDDNEDPEPKLYYTTDGSEPLADPDYLYNGEIIEVNDSMRIRALAIDAAGNKKEYKFIYSIGELPPPPDRTDFREETIYFLMTARFYDGDSSNNRYTRAGLNAGNDNNNDPSWRGDFAGLIEKLDYIKALGFSAIWITPPVLNRSDSDYHGYHAWDMTEIDGRLESPGATYQDFIDAAHDKGLKVIQDIVLNHSSRYGEKNLHRRILWGDAHDPDWGSQRFDGEADYYDEYNPDFEYDGVSVEPLSGKNFYNGDVYQKEKPTLEQMPWLADDSYLEDYRYLQQNAKELAWLPVDNLKPDLDRWGKKTQYYSPEGWPIYEYQWSGDSANMLDPKYYHLFFLGNWEAYDVQVGSIHGDCVDLNTESKATQDYLINTYNKYIEMGVDGFRVDTVKHISRVMFNRHFNPAFNQKAKEVRGKDDFYMFGEVCARVGEVWNKAHPPISQPFYTWKEPEGDSSYGDRYSERDWYAALEGYNLAEEIGTGGQPTSDNHLLTGPNANQYHQPDYSKASGMGVIDFRMHWNFQNAGNAFNVRNGDQYTNDATWNVTYVESHDYSPFEIGQDHYKRTDDPDIMAENWSLLFTWRGIPTIFYGNEILFKAGEQIDGNPYTMQLENSGRAYFGDHIEGDVTATDFGEYKNDTGELAETLNHPLAQHVRRLNMIRRRIPALQKGQYSTEGVDGNIAFKRRFTDKDTDSFVLVTIAGDATFNRIPNGTYIDAITGDIKEVTNGSLTIECSGTANARIYVLDGPGKLGKDGPYLN